MNVFVVIQLISYPEDSVSVDDHGWTLGVFTSKKSAVKQIKEHLAQDGDEYKLVVEGETYFVVPSDQDEDNIDPLSCYKITKMKVVE